MKRSSLAAIPLVTAMVLSNGPARADIVPGTPDIWLAGQANGSSVTGIFGSDTAPAESPTGLAIIRGGTPPFSVAGTPNKKGVCTETSADAGNCAPDVSIFGPGPANGIGSYKGPANPLIRVFLNNTVPTG